MTPPRERVRRAATGAKRIAGTSLEVQRRPTVGRLTRG
jgi:hypothetical protein